MSLEGREAGSEGGRERGWREGGEGGRTGGREEGDGRDGGPGGVTVIHILTTPQYLNNNHATYHVIT